MSCSNNQMDYKIIKNIYKDEYKIKQYRMTSVSVSSVYIYIYVYINFWAAPKNWLRKSLAHSLYNTHLGKVSSSFY